MSVFYIAEIGLNHNGEINLAKEMVDAAAESGANAVKFQSINYKSLITDEATKTKIDGFGMVNVHTVGDFWKKVSISDTFHHQIKEYCDHKKIEFMSTPFDFVSTDLLESLGVKRYKIASGDMTHYPLISHIVSKHKPIILSTGMADIEEIDDVVNFFKEKQVSDLTLLHCLSLYPTPANLANLKVIHLLKERYQLPVGFSDHTIGAHIPVAAIALGATVIEKHFTIDISMPGPDQKISAIPDIFRRIVSEGNDVYAAVQEENKIVSPEEIKMREFARRSIVAAQDMKAGEIITEEKLDFKRPGTGISPAKVDGLLNKITINEIKYDQQILFEDIK